MSAPLVERSSRRWLCLVLLWPFVLLLPCLVGARVFLPYDVGILPPASLSRSDAELETARDGNNFDVTETPIWFVPELQRAQRALFVDGRLPNWNPTARTGTVLLPHGHDGILYPYVWPALLFRDPAHWLAWLALLNLGTAGFLCFGFLRALRLDPSAAAFGAMAFCVSTTLGANAHNYPRLSSLVWLPGMLWALRAARDGNGGTRLRALVGFAACFALTWIGGFPPYAMPCSAIAAAYGTSLLVARARADGMRAAMHEFVGMALAAGTGVLACSHYLLPAFAFFGESARSLAPDLDRISQSAFDRYGLLGWLAPDLFGRPDAGASLPYGNAPLPLLLGDRTSHAGAVLQPNFNATEYALFAGTATLWLAVLGLCTRPFATRAVPVLVLVVCLGLATFAPGFAELFRLPGVRVVPPLRWLGPTSFVLAWLAALGLDAALRASHRRALFVGAGLALGTAALAAVLATQFADPKVFQHWHLAERLAAHYAPSAVDPSSITPQRIEQLVLRGPDGTDYAANGAAIAHTATVRAAILHGLVACLLFLFARVRTARSAMLLAIATIALTGLDLVLAGRTFDRGIARPYDARTSVHDFLLHAREMHDADGGILVARAATVADPSNLPEPAFLAPGTLAPDGVRDLQVYTYFDGRSLQPIARLFASLYGKDVAEAATGKGYLTACLPDDPRLLSHPLLDLFSLRYLVSMTPLQHAGGPPVHRLDGPRGSCFVHERPTALPRAFVVAEVRALPDDEAVLAAMVDPGFAPRRTAVLVDGPEPAADPLLRDLRTTPSPAAVDRAVRFRRDAGDRVELEVAAGAPGLLVLADTFLSGWTVSVDDEQRPVHRVDHCLRGVTVPDRACTVVFSYTPPGQRLGLLLCGLALVLLTAGLLAARTSRRNETRVDTPM